MTSETSCSLHIRRGGSPTRPSVPRKSLAFSQVYGESNSGHLGHSGKYPAAAYAM